MKLFKPVVFFLFISLFLIGGIRSANAAFAPWRPLCVGIQGKFVAKNWKGGPIEVGCVGDDGGATNQADQRCTGEVQVVQPNTEFRLTKCSCWGSNKGCLKVGKDITLNPLNSNNRKTITIVKSIKDTAAFKNNSCTINSTQIGNYCAANGSHLLDKNVKIVCEAPPTPTRSTTNTPTPTRNPSHTPTPTTRNTPTPTLPICVGPEKVTNVEVTCRNCASSEQGSTGNTNNGVIGEVNEGNGCTRRAPLAEVVGGSEKQGDFGQSITYDIKVTNRDSDACTPRSFTFTSDFDNNTSDDWFVSWNTFGGGYEVGPGDSSSGALVQIQSMGNSKSGDSLTTAVRAYFGGNDAASKSEPVTLKYTVK